MTRDRQLSIMRDMEAKTEEQTKRYDELQRKLQDEKNQRIADKHKKLEE